MYGNQWDQSVDLARLLAVSMVFSVAISLCGSVLLSSGAVATIARVTVFTALQSVVFVAIGAWQGLSAVGIALIASAAVSAVIWLRATAAHIGLTLSALQHTLRRSAAVALVAGIGPTIALWIYGPYPEVFVMPLLLGGAGGLAGFLLDVMVFRHPLCDEFTAIWVKLKNRPA